MSVIDGMVKEGSLTADQAERAKKSAEDLLKAAAADPAAMAELEKLAGIQAMKNIGKSLKTGFGQAMETTVPQVATVALLTGMMGAGTDVMKDAYRAIKSKVTENRNYQAMLEKNPSLQNHPNQDMVRDTFKTLHRFNPAYSSDPLVAGTFVQNAVDMERLDVNQVNQLVSAAKTIQDAGPKPTDLSGYAMRFHMTPEQRLLHTYNTQSAQWQAEENPALQAEQLRLKQELDERQDVEHGWKVEDRSYDLDKRMNAAMKAEREAEQAAYHADAAKATALRQAEADTAAAQARADRIHEQARREGLENDRMDLQNQLLQSAQYTLQDRDYRDLLREMGMKPGRKR